MQKILSARLDESAIDELERVSRHLGISKKQFLEEAIHMRARAAEGDGYQDVWAETAGAWKRREPAADTVRAAREKFNQSFERHHRK